MILIALIPFALLLMLDEIVKSTPVPKMSFDEEVRWLMKDFNLTQQEAEYFANLP